jgi:hypothetical protein
MAEPQPFWPWCPTPGAGRSTKLAVDEVAYGDGYKHRFWILPPDGTDYVLVTADEWSASITDRNKAAGIVGLLSVSLVQSFNPQPGA